MSTIPKWIPPLPSAGILNQQNKLPEIQANVVAEGSHIPVVLGAAQVGGKIFAIDYDADTKTWTVGYVWCVGEIQAITQVWLNGAAPDSDVTQNDYLGTTSQTADPLLAAAISGYSDTLVLTRPGGDIGIAYSVIQYTDSVYSSFPQAIAEVQGLKVNGGSYSNTPAHAIGYLIEHDVLGLSGSVDATSLGTVATDNSATVVSESRREIGLVIDKPLPFWQWLSILAGYASCWITKRGNTYFFVSDRPRAQDYVLSSDDWMAKSFSIRGPGKASVPTVVEVVYTDTTETVWRQQVAVSEDAGVAGGTVPRRVSRVSMPGITRYSQAVREATERRQKLQQMHPSIEFRGYDDLLSVEIGDVLDVTRGTTFNNQDFRVTEPPAKTLGNGILVRAAKYDNSVYSNLEPSAPTFGTTPALYQGGGIFQDAKTVFYAEDFSGKTLPEIQADWSVISDIGGDESIVTDTASPVGESVWQMGNAAGDDEVSRALKLDKKIPIVEGRLYRVVFVVSREAGTSNSFFGGVAGIAADGSTWVNMSGSDALGNQFYFAADNVLQTIDGTYETYVGYFKKVSGETATDRSGDCPISNPGYLHADVDFVIPYFLANNNNAVGQHRLAYVEIDSVEDNGARTGTGGNLTDEDGNALTDLDLKNEYVAGDQLAGNLIYNPFMTMVDPTYDRPKGPKSGYGGIVPEDIAFSDSNRNILLSRNLAGTDSSIGVVWPAFQVNTEAKYRFAVRWRMTAGNTNNGGLYFRVLYKNAAIAQGATHLALTQGESGVDTASVNSGLETLTVISDENGAAGFFEDEDVTARDVWYYTVLEWDPDSGAEWASFCMLNWTGLGANAQIEIDMLVGYEQGTFGADWDSNVANLPANLSGLTGTEGIANDDINTHLRALPNTASVWITNDGANYDPAISEGGTDTQDITVEAINNGVIASVVWRWTAQNTASSNSDTIQLGAFNGSSTGWTAGTVSGSGTAAANVVITHTASGETITLYASIVNTSVSGGGK